MKNRDLTNEELQILVEVTGVPLLYLMKMDTYSLLDTHRLSDLVIYSVYNKLKAETKQTKKAIVKSMCKHFHASEYSIKGAIDRRRKAR